MALAVTVTNHWTDGKRLHVLFNVVASGNYTTNGDTLNLQDYSIKTKSLPLYVEIHGPGLFLYRYVPGTTMQNGLMKAISLATAAEVANGAYPGGITGDTIRGYAIFHKFTTVY